MSDWIHPLLGVAVGAALQFFFNREAERKRHLETLRAQAYSDFLRAVAAAGHLLSDEDLRQAHREVADSKARIAVYGTSEVVQAMARFEETGAILYGQAGRATFVALVSAMRPSGAAVAQRDLELLLLGSGAHHPSHRRE